MTVVRESKVQGGNSAFPQKTAEVAETDVTGKSRWRLDLSLRHWWFTKERKTDMKGRS